MDVFNPTILSRSFSLFLNRESTNNDVIETIFSKKNRDK